MEAIKMNFYKIEGEFKMNVLSLMLSEKNKEELVKQMQDEFFKGFLLNKEDMFNNLKNEYELEIYLPIKYAENKILSKVLSLSLAYSFRKCLVEYYHKAVSTNIKKVYFTNKDYWSVIIK